MKTIISRIIICPECNEIHYTSKEKLCVGLTSFEYQEHMTVSGLKKDFVLSHSVADGEEDLVDDTRFLCKKCNHEIPVNGHIQGAELDPNKVEVYDCGNCGKHYIEKSALCSQCEELGYWMDPAGGIHPPDEDDHARMYE